MINFIIMAGTGKVRQRTGVLVAGLLVTVVAMITFIKVL